MELQVKDMPKLESPFVRELNEKDEYLVTDKINEEYRWVFEGGEDEVVCMEKCDGTNCSVIIQDGVVNAIFNRTTRIPFFNKGKRCIIDGFLESHERGYLELLDGQHFGELIGEGVNGNSLQIKGNLWVPFNSFGMKHLVYKSWHKYPKTYENIRDWFFKPISEGGIFSLFARMKGIELKPEGVVFYNLKTGQMCKLRMDMFAEFKGRRHGDGRKGNKNGN
jgi:hypothetical protein